MSVTLMPHFDPNPLSVDAPHKDPYRVASPAPHPAGCSACSVQHEDLASSINESGASFWAMIPASEGCMKHSVLGSNSPGAQAGPSLALQPLSESCPPWRARGATLSGYRKVNRHVCVQPGALAAARQPAYARITCNPLMLCCLM